MLKLLGGTTNQIGVYAAAQTSRSAWPFSPRVFARLALEPEPVGRWWRGRRRKGVGRNAMRLVVGLLPFVGAVAGAAHEIVAVAFGESSCSRAPIVGILMLDALILLMISVTTAILTAANKPNWILASTARWSPRTRRLCARDPRLGSLGAALVATSWPSSVCSPPSWPCTGPGESPRRRTRLYEAA